MRDLTQAEYDALPAEQKAKGLIFLPDDGSGGGGQSGSGEEIYSTEERRIGTWIDGKPIYQKTFYFGDITIARNFTALTIKLTDLDIERLLGGFVSTTSVGLYAGSGVIFWIANQTNLGLYQVIASTGTLAKDVIGVLEYTKTTDPEVSV